MIEILAKIGCEIINFDVVESWKDDCFQFIKGDLTKYQQIYDALENVDCVFHVKKKFKIKKIKIQKKIVKYFFWLYKGCFTCEHVKENV